MLIRSVAPEIHPVTSFQLPTAEIIKFSNNAELHVLKGLNQPVIKFEIVFKAGKRYEIKKGVSYLAAKMLLEGSKQYSAKQIADQIAYYGASLECSQGFDRVSLTLYCLSKHFLDLLPLVVEVVSNPTIPEKELDLLKQKTIQNIAIEKEKNSSLATTLLTKNIYGENHPYVAGQEASDISSVTQKDIQEFISQFYNLKEAVFFLTGDISNKHKDRILEGFNQNNSSSTTSEAYKVIPTCETYKFLERPEKLQSSIRIGKSWPLMQHRDYPKLALLNKILGGYFGSRLMKNIREAKGFTYGIFSTLSLKELDTLFYIGTDVNFQNTEETILEINKEITRLQEELISSDELDTVKTYTIGKFVNESTTIFDKSDKYKTIVLKNLPENFYSEYINMLQNTSPTDIQNLAVAYLNLDTLNYVVVGMK